MVRLGRLTLYGAVSTSVFAWTVLNAFRQRSNFYAAAVYLSKSNACMMILWNQAVYQTVLLGKLMQAVFFGELRLIEVERLQERGWFAITETLLALTIFREEFESSFVMLFISLLFFKVFHWLASDRVEMMEQTAQVTRTQHARMIGLLSVLWISDISLLIFAVDTILLEGPTVMIMFASEYMILLANVWSATAKYIINTIDMRSEENWEQKSIYVFYVELAADFFKLLTYLIFFSLILTFYGLPLNILRDVYLTFRSFILKIRDLRRYRQATKDMETLYPNATREEMEAMADKTCIICREDMEYRAPAGEAAAAGGAGAAPAPEGGEGGEGAEAAPAAPAGPRGPNDTPKKLPCGHVFHFHCLKSWLERQQSCPTCRRPVLPSEQPAAPPAAPGQRPPLPGNAAPPVDGAPPAANAAAADRNGADAVRQSQINLARALGREGFALLFPGVPFPPEAEAEAAAGGAGGGAAARLPQPPANGGPTLAVPPTPERVLQDPGAGAAVAAAGGAGGAEAGPSTSPPQPTPTAATPASIIPLPAAQAGNGALNPLAAFNLPQLPVPATGEAGLYHSPPSFSYPSTSTAPPPFPSATSPSPYANLAYGAYPHFSQFGPTGGMAPPPFPLPAGPTQLGQRHAQLAQRGQHGSGSGWRAGNVEEKMGRLRESWEREERRKEKGKGKEGEVAEDEEQEEEKHEKEEVSEEKEKKKDDKEERQGSEEREEDSPVNRRRAAFRTAEARLGGSKISAKDKGKGKAVEGDVADSSSSPSIHERPQVSPRASSETVTSPLQTSASTATRPAPAPLGSNQHLPRLIPLFDPTSPSVPFPLSNTTFPPLLPTSSTSSSSLPPSTAAPTTDEAQQLDALVQQALERKLKLLVEFQGRVEGLVAELKGVVEGGSVATAVSPEPAVEDGEGEETAAVKEGAETVLGEAGVEDGEGEK